jgi:glycolate oxidase FAD binding subunit
VATVDQDTLVVASRTRWGSDAVRAAARSDLVGGVPARVVLEPNDESTLADMLAWAHSERLAVVPRGAGTRMLRGRPAARVDVVLSLRRLVSPIDHRPGDLTATVPAGASLESVNASLGAERQWLPLDPPSPRSTIGGIIATNDSGPRRLQHGSPRDLILGMRMVLADGRCATAGGRVVKNVSGYDLSRMLCGSEGRLAVVTAATFKLTPVPAASRTVVAAASRPDNLGAMAKAIATSPLAPSAVELEAPAGRLLVRFETTERAATHQAEAAASILKGLGSVTDICLGRTEEEVWREHDSRIWAHEGLVMKISLLPSEVASLLTRVRIMASREGAEHFVAGRATLGVLVVRWLGPPSAAVRSVELLRQEAHVAGGTATLLSFPQPLGISTDSWDDTSTAVQVQRAVKARLDPNGVLNPGRGPGGS